MVTAFQQDAFQNDAFQIDLQAVDTHDFPDHIKKRLKYNPLTQTYILYDKAAEVNPAKAKKLRRIIRAYTKEPEAETLPKREEVAFDFMALNTMAVEIYLKELNGLKEEIEFLYARSRKIKQEEELIEFLFLTC